MVTAGHQVEPSLEYIRMSYEEWLNLPPQPRNEWVDGVAVVMAAFPRWSHQTAARRIAARVERDLPELFVNEAVGLRLPRNRVRGPDVVALSEQPPPDTDEPDSWVVDLVPVLVAEVLSPSTRREDLVRKAPEYLEAGIEQYWVVDPQGRSIEPMVSRDGRWETIVVVDDHNPRADVDVGGYGTVHLDLAEILDR